MTPTCIIWALNTLENLGYSVQNPTPEVVLQTPWSSVYRFDTDQGHYYLKQVPPKLSLEPRVINLLGEICVESVPLLIANNPQERCFLMQDAGIPLRDQFSQHGFEAELLMTTVHNYSTMQQKSLAHLDFFLTMGVSDWRVIKIPKCYAELIQQEELLIADGLTRAELIQLSQLTSKLNSLCTQLSGHPIPDTFSHSDLHDKNILIHPETKQITLVDLGEVAIAHPFFSLNNILFHAKERYELPENQYQLLQEQALQTWLDYAPLDQLLEVMSLIQQCWSIDAALTEYRLITSVDAGSLPQLLGQSRIAKKLRVWLNQ